MSGSEEDSQDKKRGHATSSDENSKDEPIQSRLRLKKSKASNIYSSSSEEEVSEDDKKKKKTKGKGKAPARSTKGKVEHNDVEEGEVSDESSDGDSSDEMEFLDGYDENLLGDDEDRERLARMTEREREEEIFKRLEHRQAMQRRHELERKLRKRASQAGKSKKSLTNAVDDTSARSKERRLMVEGKKDTKAKAIEDLRAAREEKKSRAAEQEKKKAAVKPRKRRDTESDDEEDDDEEEEDLKDVKRKQVQSSSDSDSENSETGKKGKDGGRDISQEPVQNFSELEKIRLSRFRLTKWLYLPNFSDLVKGFYVRVNFGDMEQGRPVYRIAEIIGLGEGAKAYEFSEPGSNKSIMTTVTLRLRVFEREKEMNMTFISNQTITEKEFSEFKHRMANRDMSLPTREHVEKKLSEFNQANNYQMTDADITHMLAQKEKLGMKPKNLAMRKAQLVKMKESAIRLNDLEEMARIQPELDELQLAMKERDAPRQAGQVKIEAINRRNQSAAMEALGKALSTRDQKRESDRGTDDPFTRRWGTPLLVHKKTEKKILPLDLKIETVDVKTETTSAPAPLVPVKADPFNLHNFDIGLNIDIGDFPLPSSSFSRRTK